ncbi:hypothetical protein [Endozoicomonas ascidiicola]|uniref:hypothetical protein n=1 Tax=Endozoicomonas ascidiicola TaxID=1698521 RepID=UPI00082D1180|nr:hypothetical protein [Endozoicomonas ascidiicola]
MKLIAFRPGINSAQWHGAFVKISQYTTMEEIESAVSDFYNEQDEKEIELRVYNETSTFIGYSPSEDNHIGFIRYSVESEDRHIQHLTVDRQPVEYKEWDACEFYRGQALPRSHALRGNVDGSDKYIR